MALGLCWSGKRRMIGWADGGERWWRVELEGDSNIRRIANRRQSIFLKIIASDRRYGDAAMGISEMQITIAAMSK
jgi:hypothetical protein